MYNPKQNLRQKLPPMNSGISQGSGSASKETSPGLPSGRAQGARAGAEVPVQKSNRPGTYVHGGSQQGCTASQNNRKIEPKRESLTEAPTNLTKMNNPPPGYLNQTNIASGSGGECRNSKWKQTETNAMSQLPELVENKWIPPTRQTQIVNCPSNDDRNQGDRGPQVGNNRPFDNESPAGRQIRGQQFKTTKPGGGSSMPKTNLGGDTGRKTPIQFYEAKKTGELANWRSKTNVAKGVGENNENVPMEQLGSGRDNKKLENGERHRGSSKKRNQSRFDNEEELKELASKSSLSIGNCDIKQVIPKIPSRIIPKMNFDTAFVPKPKVETVSEALNSSLSQVGSSLQFDETLCGEMLPDSEPQYTSTPNISPGRGSSLNVTEVPNYAQPMTAHVLPNQQPSHTRGPVHNDTLVASMAALAMGENSNRQTVQELHARHIMDQMVIQTLLSRRYSPVQDLSMPCDHRAGPGDRYHSYEQVLSGNENIGQFNRGLVGQDHHTNVEDNSSDRSISNLTSPNQANLIPLLASNNNGCSHCPVPYRQLQGYENCYGPYHQGIIIQQNQLADGYPDANYRPLNSVPHRYNGMASNGGRGQWPGGPPRGRARGFTRLVVECPPAEMVAYSLTPPILHPTLVVDARAQPYARNVPPQRFSPMSYHAYDPPPAYTPSPVYTRFSAMRPEPPPFQESQLSNIPSSRYYLPPYNDMIAEFSYNEE